MRRILLVILLVILLICVRMFETDLFYDPLLLFFTSDFALLPLPDVNDWKLLGSTALRFLVNTGISLVILWVVFRSKEMIKVSVLLYSVFFVILMALFFILLQRDAVGDHLALFYTRRFLIQPLFLLILLPAFYVQQKTTSKK